METSMQLRITVLFFLFFMSFLACYGQSQPMSFRDTIKEYNRLRINTNTRGTKTMAVWGLANVSAGTVGYFAATADDWKYFHAPNAFCGLINTGVSVLGFRNIRLERAEKFNHQLYYNRYQANKKLYLIDAGIDVLILGAGTGLSSFARTDKSNPALFRGVGSAIALQGAVRLLWDNIMYYSHVSMNTRWYRIMDEISISGTGLGLSYNF